MNNYPKNSYQETNNKNRQAGLSPIPIVSIFPNQKTDPNTFLNEGQQNINQYLYNADSVLSKGIVNNNDIKYPKNPREYGLYVDRKQFTLEMPLYPNISENVASENVSEYVVVIDSSDRNTSLYPSPFKLKAFFNQSDDSLKLNIPRVFENVKFMRIENVILPRNYFLTKYAIADVVTDALIPNEDKPILIQLLPEIITYTSTGADVPSPLTTNNVNTVKVINLKLYSYTLQINYKNTVGYYTVVYPSDNTFNKQYYEKTYASGAKTNNNDVETYCENANYNMGTKRAIVGDYELLFTLDSVTLINYIIKFMINNNVSTRRCYEFTVQPNGIAGLLNFYYFSSKSLDGDRYIMLSIDEITDNNINSTNSALRSAFCLLYPDSYGELHYYAASNYQDKIYKMSSLGNINRLTLTLYDSYGKELTMPNLDYNINSTKSCICTDSGCDHSCPCTYIRNPFYKWLQVQYMIKLGVVETEIDKKIFY